MKLSARSKIIGVAFVVVQMLARYLARLAGHADEASLVAERTRALAERSRKMRMLLDSVTDSLAVIGLDGKLGEERSKRFDEWFPGNENASIASLLRVHDADVADWFELAWEGLNDGVLPLEVAIEQFPPRLIIGERRYELVVTPILDEAGQLTNALLVMTDATARFERAHVDSNQREVLGLLELLLDDRSAFMQFLNEGDAIVQRVAKGVYSSMAELKRDIHTLKGNAGLVGVASVAEACHELENRLELGELTGAATAVTDLAQRWTTATAALARVYAKTSSSHIDVERMAYESLLEAIETEAPRAVIARRARLLALEPVRNRLERLAEHGAALATRLDKQVTFSTKGDALYFNPRTWGRFWSALAHAVRNALHHGVDSPAEREKAGKNPIAHIALEARAMGASLVLDIKDDGRGIDWEAIRERARARGLDADTAEHLREALFADGLSSAEHVSDIAGRGVGMGALRAAAVQLEGTCRVVSSLGEGTNLRFVFPLSALGKAYRNPLKDLLSRGVG